MSEQPENNEKPVSSTESMPRSLRELIDRVTGRSFKPSAEDGDSGIAEVLPFPFLALVGQREMKIALLLALINPAVGGVLLIGPRGTGKTTAVRSLVDLLPEVMRSLCYFGCLPEDVETGGMDAVCPDCARRYAQGEPLAKLDRARLVELPLNAGLADVIGGLDERAAVHQRMRLQRGILAQADKNILFVDEVNLLADEIVDAILDAAAQGSYTVRRGPVAATYRSSFTLIGSMNPEEGRLRPQILDRFGLRIIVRGLNEPAERLDAYNRVRDYLSNPRRVIANFRDETQIAREEILSARERLPKVRLSEAAAQAGLDVIRGLEIDSLRAEITLFEAARAYAAADGRELATVDDLREVAPMALRQRRSAFMVEYFNNQAQEESEIRAIVHRFLPENP